MPTYDFKCEVCGRRWEAVQKMSDPNPKCGAVLEHSKQNGEHIYSECAGESEKVFGKAAPIHFHGSGWAKDGYK